MSIAFTFPGQGSQQIGMGKDLADAYPEAKAVFEEVDEALGQKLTTLMWEGPEDQLTLTENAQPALMAVSLAAMRVLEAEGGWKLADKASFVAGHSLGEYSALAAVGAFALDDTARLLKHRGKAMQAAVPVGEGSMCALLGADLEKATALAEAAAQGEVCEVANDNDPGQVVLSGHAGAIARAVEMAKEYGCKRAVPLPVSAPFHSSLMQPAADAMEEALGKVPPKPMLLPVYSNFTATLTSDPAVEQDLLVKQVTGRVRWRESVEAMGEAGVTHFVELGGKVLAPMVRKILPESTQTSVISMEDIEALAKEL